MWIICCLKIPLTVTAVNEILAQIPSDQKTIYDEQTIKALLDKHLTQGGKLQKDFNRLASELKGREVLILCPGKKLFEQKHKVDAYIAAHHPLVVYANFFTEAFDCDYILVSNAKRYSQMYYYLKKRDTQKKIIAVTHVTDIGNTVDFMLKR